MNKRKYKDSFYEVREIADLRELINSSVELHNNKPAFLVKDKPGGEYKPISYGQFSLDINALGTVFLEMGLKGKKIAVIGENSYEWVVAYLATVNGTGIVVPIDRELAPREIANLLNRSGANALVYSHKMKETIEEVLPLATEHLEHKIRMGIEEDGDETPTLYRLIQEGKKSIAEGNTSFLDAEIDREGLCSLLFTSGTTGMAKGVMLSHKNIVANVYNMSKYVKIIENGVGLSVLPMHHSYEMTCHVLTGLYQGITIAICEGLKHIQKNLQESRTTVMLGVPLIFESMHKKVMKSAEASGQLKKIRRALSLSRKLKLYNNQGLMRTIFKQVHETTGNNVWQFIAGGAAINPKVIEDFEAMGFPMIQGYGMTENAPIIAVNRDRYSKAASVGRPMPGTEVKIVDPDETGMGEIICKGPSVMLGYYDDPEETKKVIRDGWLYTGDYGHLDDEGFLYISGRKKNVIVTKNGKNIFPEEVEFYLSESEYIAEALVHGVEDGRTGDTVIKAEIFPNYELVNSKLGSPGEEEIEAFIKDEVDRINEQMPLYKRVRRVAIRKTEFEKTTTRKIKRHISANMTKDEE
ncbi:MAG: AMP-dependent synthetase/ligase [Anaerovoracaceae bacterium]|jgi:long-chain acyl-CoA synthetase